MNDSAILALEEAIKLEADGHDYYLRMAETARHPLVKALFNALATEEKGHMKRVREIYEELKDKGGWPTELEMVAKASGVVDVFEREAMRDSLPSDASISEALLKAISMEEEALRFYRDRAAKASCSTEGEFFKRLADDEVVHLDALQRALG